MDEMTMNAPQAGNTSMTSREWPTDIVALGAFVLLCWIMTALWMTSDPEAWLASQKVSEADVWLLTLSGAIFLPLLAFWVASWWPVIMAGLHCLLAVHVVLRRMPPKVRWVSAVVAALFVGAFVVDREPGGLQTYMGH